MRKFRPYHFYEVMCLNSSRRGEISRVIDKLEDIKQEVAYIRDDEQESLDNMPENLESSERYASMEQAVDNLEDAVSGIEDAIDSLNKASE